MRLIDDRNKRLMLMMKSPGKNMPAYPGILILFLFLSGCLSSSTSSTPLDIQEIPAPPGSSLYEGPYEATLDMAYITTRQAFGRPARSCEEQTLHYLLESQGDGLDEPLRFYSSAFEKTDWQPDETLDAPGVQRWKRESTAGSQTLTLGVIPFRQGDSTDHLLMMVLVSGDAVCHP